MTPSSLNGQGSTRSHLEWCLLTHSNAYNFISKTMISFHISCFMMLLNPAFMMHRPLCNGSSQLLSGTPRPWPLQGLGLQTPPPPFVPASSWPLEGAACPLNKCRPELCVCCPASWETGSGIAKGLLWVNISLNLILATSSAQSEVGKQPHRSNLRDPGMMQMAPSC